MFIPLHDGVKLIFLKRPFVTLGLIACNIAVYAFTFVFVPAPDESLNLSFGLIPSVLTGRAAIAPELQMKILVPVKTGSTTTSRSA
jgi:hypothetical protein